MKKRFLMMMLAGVLAFSMIGCGGNDAPAEDPNTGDEIVDVEGGETEGEAEGDAKTEMSTEELIEKVKGLLKCAGYLAKADRGFDLYVSEDGINFETITTNGLGDPTNHGLRVFANMDCGLMIGTANPFWAGQVWMMTDDGEIVEKEADLFDKIQEVFADIWETICGIFTTIGVIFANWDVISETITSVISGIQNGTLFAA